MPSIDDISKQPTVRIGENRPHQRIPLYAVVNPAFQSRDCPVIIPRPKVTTNNSSSAASSNSMNRSKSWVFTDGGDPRNYNRAHSPAYTDSWLQTEGFMSAKHLYRDNSSSENSSENSKKSKYALWTIIFLIIICFLGVCGTIGGIIYLEVFADYHRPTQDTNGTLEVHGTDGAILPQDYPDLIRINSSDFFIVLEEITPSTSSPENTSTDFTSFYPENSTLMYLPSNTSVDLSNFTTEFALNQTNMIYDGNATTMFQNDTKVSHRSDKMTNFSKTLATNDTIYNFVSLNSSSISSSSTKPTTVTTVRPTTVRPSPTRATVLASLWPTVEDQTTTPNPFRWWEVHRYFGGG